MCRQRRKPWHRGPIVAFVQEPGRRVPMPPDGMLERRHQLRERSTRESRTWRLLEPFWNHPVDPPLVVTGVEVEVLEDCFGDANRRLDYLAVHINDVERAIRCIGDLYRTKPGVLRRQELDGFLVRGAFRA